MEGMQWVNNHEGPFFTIMVHGYTVPVLPHKLKVRLRCTYSVINNIYYDGSSEVSFTTQVQLFRKMFLKAAALAFFFKIDMSANSQ